MNLPVLSVVTLYSLGDRASRLLGLLLEHLQRVWKASEAIAFQLLARRVNWPATAGACGRLKHPRRTSKRNDAERGLRRAAG